MPHALAAPGRAANTGVRRARCNRCAASSASLVLPIPPDPINVTNRAGPGR